MTLFVLAATFWVSISGTLLLSLRERFCFHFGSVSASILGALQLPCWYHYILGDLAWTFSLNTPIKVFSRDFLQKKVVVTYPPSHEPSFFCMVRWCWRVLRVPVPVSCPWYVLFKSGAQNPQKLATESRVMIRYECIHGFGSKLVLVSIGGAEMRKIYFWPKGTCRLAQLFVKNVYTMSLQQ